MDEPKNWKQIRVRTLFFLRLSTINHTTYHVYLVILWRGLTSRSGTSDPKTCDPLSKTIIFIIVADTGWRARPRCLVHNCADMRQMINDQFRVTGSFFMSAACGRTPGTWREPTLAWRRCKQLAGRFQRGPSLLFTTAARTSSLLSRCLAAMLLINSPPSSVLVDGTRAKLKTQSTSRMNVIQSL